MSGNGSSQSARAPRPQVVRDSSALFERMKRTLCREAPQLSPSQLLVTEDMVVEEVVKEVTVGDPNPVPRLGRILGAYKQQQQLPWTRKHRVTPGGGGQNRGGKGASGCEELEVSCKRKDVSLEDDYLMEAMSPRFMKRHGPSAGRSGTGRNDPGYQSPMMFPEEYSDTDTWQSRSQQGGRPASAGAPPAASSSRVQRPATSAGTRMNKTTQQQPQLWGGGPSSQGNQVRSPRPDTQPAPFTSSEVFNESPSSFGVPIKPLSESGSRKPCTGNWDRQPLCSQDLFPDQICVESMGSSETVIQSALDELNQSFILRSPTNLLHMTPRSREGFLAGFPDGPKRSDWSKLSSLDTDLDIPDISYPPPPSPRRNIGRLCCDSPYPNDQRWTRSGSQYENYNSY